MPARKVRQSLGQALLYFGSATLIYVLLLFLLPVNRDATHTYHLTTLEYHVLLFAISIPTLLLWSVAFSAYALLAQYAHAVRHTEDGYEFGRLATGLTVLAWGLPVAGIITLLLSGIANAHTGFSAAATIIANYAGLIIPLVGFSVIGSAARGLVTLHKPRITSNNARGIVLLFVIIGVLYCLLTFRYFDLESLSRTDNPYFLPVWLAVISVVIPYLYTWYVGLLATYEITIYSKSVQGALYRQPLQLLVAGLTVVIVSSIAIQFISTAVPPAGQHLLTSRLVFLLLCRVIEIVGFGLLALGAVRLKRIEEI